MAGTSANATPPDIWPFYLELAVLLYGDRTEGNKSIDSYLKAIGCGVVIFQKYDLGTQMFFVTAL